MGILVNMLQESMYQSYQERNKKVMADTYDDDISDWRHLLEDEGESSRRKGVMTQEEIDEALARSLQDLGDGFDDLIISEHSSRASGQSQLNPILQLKIRNNSFGSVLVNIFMVVRTLVKNSGSKYNDAINQYVQVYSEIFLYLLFQNIAKKKLC